MKRLTFVLALCLFFAACESEEYSNDATELSEEQTTVTQDVGNTQGGAFGEWDADADASVGESEFLTGLGTRNEFGNWDADASGNLDENEFGTGIFGTWDADNNNMLDENEWTSARESWFGDNWAHGDWSEWDADGNSELTQDEFSQRWNETNLFSEWDGDTDSQLTEEEWGSGLYDTWDADNDMRLTEDDFNRWNPFWDWI